MQLPLPNELVDSIIDNLHSDIASLLECALVGRAWARSSQRGIFRQIVLNPFLRTDDYLKTTERLVAAFDAQPRLESYVRSLELRGFWSTNTRVDAATASVVQRLANMNDLTLSSINWTVLSPMLKAKLTGIFQSPSLRQVFSRDLHMPAFAELASLLACARHLKVLDLSADCVDSTLPTEIAVDCSEVYTP
ncbi:hypothetical protein BT96DRAFT_1004141 [Gymnopus androsaceus JB14]|uniref:F-box domain-containing protein n=1 Tax=Gymnopus androsaceus JB14 TaxID=1447944 RepID=A0A6A4GSS8_9AGAR|nr:hypothetical protein BT96DRAFT_1004141 [Gymnopus androsaceus JB14]